MIIRDFLGRIKYNIIQNQKRRNVCAHCSYSTDLWKDDKCDLRIIQELEYGHLYLEQETEYNTI